MSDTLKAKLQEIHRIANEPVGWRDIFRAQVRQLVREALALLSEAEAPREVYPNSDRGLLAMTDRWADMDKAARLGTLRGIQEAAFRAGREDALTAQPAAAAPAPTTSTWDAHNEAVEPAIRALDVQRARSLAAAHDIVVGAPAPPQTCATCRHGKDDRHEGAIYCDNPESPIRSITRPRSVCWGCTLHEPAPAAGDAGKETR